MIWCWRFGRKDNSVVPNMFDVSDLIEYVSIFLKIGSDNVLVSKRCDDVNLVEFSC